MHCTGFLSVLVHYNYNYRPTSAREGSGSLVEVGLACETTGGLGGVLAPPPILDIGMLSQPPQSYFFSVASDSAIMARVYIICALHSNQSIL